MNRIPIAALVAMVALSLTLWRPDLAVAQVVPPNRNAASFTIATFSGAPVYSLGVDFVLTPTLDATLAYSYQSVGGVTGSLLGLGVRHHFPVTAPGTDVFIGGGFASASNTLPGFGTVNASGLFVGGGGSVRLGNKFAGYASGSVFSLSGTSNSVFDLGVQIEFAPRISGQVGYINFAGSGAPYFGINVTFP